MDELCAKDSFKLFVAVWASRVGEGKGLSYRGSIFSLLSIFNFLKKEKRKEKPCLDHHLVLSLFWVYLLMQFKEILKKYK